MGSEGQLMEGKTKVGGREGSEGQCKCRVVQG